MVMERRVFALKNAPWLSFFHSFILIPIAPIYIFSFFSFLFIFSVLFSLFFEIPDTSSSRSLNLDLAFFFLNWAWVTVSPKRKYTLLSSWVVKTEGAEWKVGGALHPFLSDPLPPPKMKVQEHWNVYRWIHLLLMETVDKMLSQQDLPCCITIIIFMYWGIVGWSQCQWWRTRYSRLAIYR